MNRVDLILEHPKYQEYIDKIKQAEEKRIFCLHNMNHFLDVARIAYIMNLEEELGISKEIIYVTALLHDIGRFVQYEDGMPHEKASAELAEELLQETGFDKKEQSLILRAIREHRNKEMADEKSLAGIIYRADKASRACFACEAEVHCDWDKSKKNMRVKY